MTEAQLNHLNEILRTATKRLEHKYIAGQAEHGGNLWEKDTLWIIDQAIDEAVDQFVYLSTIKSQLEHNKPSDIPRDLAG